MEKYDELIARMGETQRWKTSGDIEVIWNDRVLVVVDSDRKQIAIMASAFMTVLEVRMPGEELEDVSKEVAGCRKV